MHTVPGLVRATAALLILGAATFGCASSAPDTPASLTVEAAFYPLVWVTERLGGDHVAVGNLTKTGVEPHDLELTPRDTARIVDADLVVYLSRFQPAVDSAIADTRDGTSFDAADAADLTGGDPHFWLDPTRLALVADALADALIELDPAHAEAYRANRDALATQLADLDAEFRSGLASCAHRDLVSSHLAFGYLAARYDLEEVGIQGLNADAGPTAADLARVADHIAERDIPTIFVETGANTAIARRTAQEGGADVATIDPLETITEQSEGDDYLEIMRSNLKVLRDGLVCE